MGGILESLTSVINTPERYEIAIDIYDNFNDLIKPLRENFFNTIETEVRNLFKLDEEWCFYDHEKVHFCLFKHSWRIDKSDRGIYSFILHNNEGSGLVRNNSTDPNILIEEEQYLVSILKDFKGIHSWFPDNTWWFLFNRHNLFNWTPQEYKKICDPNSKKFKSMVGECVERFKDLLTFMEESNLEQVIDNCVKARRSSNKL